MRKVLKVFLAGLLVTMFCSVTFAEEKKESMMGNGMMQSSMMEQQASTKDEGMMGKDKMMGMGNMRCMMMDHMMMSKALVATSDGGIVVLIGNKLQKYNKDLVLQKEVEIKIDMESMQKMMEKCSMQKKMMGTGMMSENKNQSKQ